MLRLIFLSITLITATGAFSQSNLDQRVTFLMDSLNLSEKKLEKLNEIDQEQGRDSKAWVKAYEQWDTDFRLSNIDLRLEIARVFNDKPRFAKELVTAKGLSHPYINYLLNELHDENRISEDTYVFYEVVLSRQMDSSFSEVLPDISRIIELINEDGKNGGASMDDFKKIVQFIFTLNPSWKHYSPRNILANIKSFSESDRQALAVYAQKNGLSPTMLNGGAAIFRENNGDVTSHLLMNLAPSYHHWSFLTDRGESEVLKWDSKDFLKYAPFFKNTDMVTILIGSALFTQLDKAELESLDETRFGKSTFLNTNTLASKWFVELEDGIIRQFRESVPHSERGRKEIFELLKAMQNEIYFQIFSSKDDFYTKFEMLNIDELELTFDQRKVIDLFLANGSLKGTELALIDEELIHSNWQSSIQFRMAVFIANVRCGQTTKTDWYLNAYQEQAFSGAAIGTRSSYKQKDLERLKRTIKRELQTYSNPPTHYTIILHNHVASIAYPILTEKNDPQDLRKSIRGVNTHDYLKDDAMGINYFRFVIDMSAEAAAKEEIRRGQQGPAPPVAAVSEGPIIQFAEAEIIEFPDVDARFPGGVDAMKKWIDENLQYPEISVELGDQGRVFVEFVVERDGSISGVDVMRGGITSELNREAKRLVRSMPKWEPAELKGEKVRARCRLPITFSLENQK